MNRLKVALYPFLLCLSFVFLVFARNLGDVYLGQVVRASLLLLLTTAVFTGLLGRLLCNYNKGALVTALLLTFTTMLPGLESDLPDKIAKYPLALLMVEFAGILTVMLFLLRTVKNWVPLNQTFNLVAITLLALTLYRIVSYGASPDRFIFEPNTRTQVVTVDKLRFTNQPFPNIYYLMVDGYARGDVLKEFYNYDNGEFIDFLKDTGFHVANNSFGNYNTTRLAVSSVLNMDYVADEEGFRDEWSRGYPQAIIDRTYNNKVAASLKSTGYKIVTVRSNDFFGKHMQISGAEDITLDGGWISLNEFEAALLNSTIFRTRNFRRAIRKIRPDEANLDPRSEENVQRERDFDRASVDFVFDEISRQAGTKGPLFLVAHIMAPHHPFVYDKTGGMPTMAKWQFGKSEYFELDAKAYAEQVHHVNVLLKNLIEDILAKSSTPPIIVLHGDHGLRLTWWENQKDPDDRKQLESICKREVFANLNAIYMPGARDQTGFYDSISPVNNFRLIFNAYFGTENSMLDDRTFLSTITPETKSFIEITGSQNNCTPEWERRFQELD